MPVDRRQFLKLAGLGGVVFASGLARAADSYVGAEDEFFFVQLSDTHWGFQGPAVNPDAGGTLAKAVAAVNALAEQPDLIVFTGDLTHTTDDPRERRRRLAGFRDIVKGLKNPNVRFMPGEHDASLDHGEAFKEFFGPTHYTFDHKGVHFIVLDNVSDPAARIGEEQLAWLRADLAQRKAAERIVVLTHRPLFPLFPAWDWATRDGDKALEALMPFQNVTVFYGHIHQEHHFRTGHI
jgi:3',5'-cyclic AMP phosphodiesterase CpdA